MHITQLRDRVKDWLDTYGKTQHQMALSANISEQLLCDFLAGRRGLSEVSCQKLACLINQPNAGARITNVQHFGTKETDPVTYDIEQVKAQFEQERSTAIHAANKRRQQIDL